MAVAFFYLSIAAFFIILVVSHRVRPLRAAGYITGAATAAYSLAFELLLGYICGLYYYVHPSVSLGYMLLASILLYPVSNMLYVKFLPSGRIPVLIYTGIWIAGMLAFEYASVLAGTLVFTGWRAFPWSIVTYVVTYTLIYVFYRYLQRRRIPA